MSGSAATRKAYQFHWRLNEMSAALRRDRPIGELRELARRIWREEGTSIPFPNIVCGRGWELEYWKLCSYVEALVPARIVLSRDMRSVLVLIHELAHVLGPWDKLDHGPAFQARNFHLLSRYGGASPADLIAAALEARL
jgi:hypothetical protein